MTKALKPVTPRRRVTGVLSPMTFAYKGGPVGQAAIYSGSTPFTAPGQTSVMSDFVGSYRQFSEQHPFFTERPCSVITVDHQPYVTSSYTRTSFHPNPAQRGWETVTGPSLAFIFGSLASPSIAGDALAWDKIPAADLATVTHRSKEATTNTWKGVAPSQASAWVTALEGHKTWKLLLSKGRTFVKLHEAAVRGEKEFRRVLQKATGLRVKKSAIPKKFLLLSPTGQPLTFSGRRLYTYGKYKETSDASILTHAERLLLEYRYGWRILVYEIIDTLKALYAEDLRGELTRFSRSHQVARYRKTYRDQYSAQLNSVAGGITYTGNTFVEWETSLHCWVRWKLSNDPLFRKLNDFGLFDVSRSIWDLIPYSFVVDMIIDVSGYLKAVDAKMKANVLSSGHSVERKFNLTRTLTGSNAASLFWPPVAPIGAQDFVRARIYDRKSYLGLPSSPLVQVNLDLPKMADLYALAAQARKGSSQNLRV